MYFNNYILDFYFSMFCCIIFYGDSMQKLENIKVMFVDVDGTLTNSKKQISKANSEAIRKAVEKGIKVVICSGRGNKNIELVSKTVNASPYIISSNGAEIFNYETKETLKGHEINKDIISKITNFINEKKAGFIINCSNKRYGNKYLNRELDDGDLFVDNVDEVEEKIYQLVIEAYSYELLEEMIRYVNKQDEVKILNYSPAYLEGIKTEKQYYLDVDNNGVNKGAAIKEFLEIFNIKKEDSLCFGDYINDVDMFEACGFGVAMGNATDDIKKISSFVTKTNDENGVAYFIENYIL